MSFKIFMAIVVSNCLFGIFWKKSIVNGGSAMTFLFILGITYFIAASIMYVSGFEFATNPERIISGSVKIQMILSAVAATFLYVLMSNLWTTQDISRLMPMVNMGSIVLFTLVGLIVFQEKFSWDKIAGLFFALVSIFFLSYKQIVKGWN